MIKYILKRTVCIVLGILFLCTSCYKEEQKREDDSMEMIVIENNDETSKENLANFFQFNYQSNVDIQVEKYLNESVVVTKAIVYTEDVQNFLTTAPLTSTKKNFSFDETILHFSEQSSFINMYECLEKNSQLSEYNEFVDVNYMNFDYSYIGIINEDDTYVDENGTMHTISMSELSYAIIVLKPNDNGMVTIYAICFKTYFS